MGSADSDKRLERNEVDGPRLNGLETAATPDTSGPGKPYGGEASDAVDGAGQPNPPPAPQSKQAAMGSYDPNDDVFGD